MAAAMIRLCPSCKTERALTELYCEGEVNGASCGWDMTSVAVTEPGRAPLQLVPVAPVGPVCTNGHPMSPGDFLCARCGADVATAAAPATAAEVTADPSDIAGWQRGRDLKSSGLSRERFIVTRASDGVQAVMTLYAAGNEPDPAVYDILRTLPRDYIPDLLQTGRWNGRAFEVTEELAGGTLADLGMLPDDLQTLSRVVSEVGTALHAFAERGLRHRDLRPASIVIRSREPLDIVITSFGSMRLSELDLDIVSALETTRYTSPEGIAGGVAAASDWWSLGVILLEQVTRGACFEGVNDQAFLIHVLANGAPIPEGIDPRVQLLLRGLLARDRRERWAWPEVTRWLAGESPPVPRSSLPAGAATGTGSGIVLAGRTLTTPTAFAIAAADPRAWNEARDLLMRGAVASWAEGAGLDAQSCGWLREITRTEGLSDDFRLALALKRLNPAVPLVCRGEIVTPGWLLDHPDEGHALISGPMPTLLQRMDAEPWLSRLEARASSVRERSRQFEIEMNEEHLRVHLLSTSRSRLALLWSERRIQLPDTEHPALAALIERRQPGDEDLILLLSAAIGQFRTPAEILKDAASQASRAGLAGFDRDEAAAHLRRPRVEVYEHLEDRVAGFVRSGIARVDEWVDQFRLERRLPLARALVILSVPKELWREPPGQQYVATLLDFFARRVASAVQRGPLARMVVGKTSARIDLTELGTTTGPVVALLDRILVRGEQMFDVDPTAFAATALLERRVRHLHTRSTLYRRDTGIDGLYLGFPFLLMLDARATVRPRIAPVMLWPVRLRPTVGRSRRVSLGFDRDREEVRLNPALDGLLGQDVVQKWQALANDLLQRQTLTAGEVMDAFGTLAESQGRVLVPLPGKDTRVKSGPGQIICSAVVFHLSYVGQSASEDLRQLKGIPPAGTALETSLRLAEVTREPLATVPEIERFFTADSDPSQEAAVFEARRAPGLTIEGPPGTGKSQTIVNMIADSIGRGSSVLVVCQKQPALEVVRKRLVAEGFGNRFIMITDVHADRERVVRAVREQIEALRSTAPPLEQVNRTRTQLAARLQTLKADLDAHHAALHAADPATGLTYRVLLGDLLTIERKDVAPIDAPELRTALAAVDVQRTIALEDACGPLAQHWLPAQFEGSALDALSAFAPDTGTLQAFKSGFEAFATAESARDAVVEKTPAALYVSDARESTAWLNASAPIFRRLEAGPRAQLARWLPLFTASAESGGAKLLAELAEVRRQLEQLADVAAEAPRVALSRINDRSLQLLAPACERLSHEPESFFASISPARWLSGRRVSAFFSKGAVTPMSAADLLPLVGHEQAVRPWRTRLMIVAERLRESRAEAAQLPRAALVKFADDLSAQLSHVQQLATRVHSSPSARQAAESLQQGTVEAFEAFVISVVQGCERHAARARSLAALAGIAPYLAEDWRTARQVAIDGDQGNQGVIAPVQAALPTLAAYQRFRVQVKLLPDQALAVFRCLRHQQAVLEKVPAHDLEAVIRHTIAREARLAWKTRIEGTYPILLTERDDLEAKQRSLRDLDTQLRTANRSLLVDGIDMTRISSAREWEDITRLRGQRARRLREFLSRGFDLGLTALRPVWLMNPDVASRVLPLRPGLFDTVIFDEASQMPVELAVPALYRGRVMIVSGDEKQMPPTSFFSSRVDNDEDEPADAEELEEALGDDGRTELALSWNRREIKDCPDLLQLSKSTLPTTTLKIHYRSSFRELIAFSNASFYRNDLHIPVRHPDDKVRTERPVRVVRADGVYEDQTNPSEAGLVVDMLKQLWSVPVEQRKSCGVVTFNRKQADLIEDQLEQRAESDAAFRDALTRERERVQDGEDMSFFVKNVENVQGDERDVIVFSSTFGRNRQGTFRRNFGVLGQIGGERRLNVAVTRAKERVVLVTSMPVNEVSDLLTTHRPAASARDFLQAYLEYARAASAGELDASRALLARMTRDRDDVHVQQRADVDGFVRTVMAFIDKLGHRAIPLHDSGVFGLDLVIEDRRTGLYGIGIECDAPRHPLLADARAREVWRPSLLSRTISRVHRVSSNGWYADRTAEQARLQRAVEESLG